MKPNPLITQYRTPALLLCILTVGLVLRMNGIEWGLPNELHPGYSYHQDELFLLGWADMLQKGTIMPLHFIYGGTFYYLTLQVTNWLGILITNHIGGIPVFNIILLGRLSGVVYALLTLYLVYAIGRALFSVKTGLLAAFILAILPAHVFSAQRVRPDELFALQFTLNFLIMARIFKGEGKIYLNLALGGLLLGMSIATRFPAGVLFIGYGAALFLAGKGKRDPGQVRPLIAHLALLAGITGMGYFLASPHSLLYFSTLISGLKVQWLYQGNVFENAINRGPIWFQYGGRILSQALGYPFYILMLIALAAALWKRRRQDLLLLAILVPYFLLLAKTSWVVTRYTVPLMPALSLLIADMLLRAADKGKYRQTFIALILVGAVSWTVATDLAYSNALKRPDPRDLAALWIAREIEPDATVGTFVEFEADLGTYPPRVSGHRWEYFNLKKPDIAPFLDQAFDYIVVNLSQLADAKRLGANYPNTTYQHLVTWTDQHPGYSVVQDFSNKVTFAGLDMSILFTSIDDTLSLPHIAIYKKD